MNTVNEMLDGTIKMESQDKKAEINSWVVEHAKNKGEYRPYSDDSYEELYFRFFRNIPKDASIVDVGCASGFFLNFLHQKGHTNLTGIDISPDLIAIGKEKYPHLHLIVGDAEKMEFDDAAFDVSTCNGLLHHFKDTKKPLIEIRRVGKKTIMIEPNNENPHIWLLMSKESPVRYDTLTINEEPLNKLLFLHAGATRIDYIFLHNYNENSEYIAEAYTSPEKKQIAKLFFEFAHKYQKICDRPQQDNFLVAIFEK
jgi:ubiquinone/menaquinone biosynthesis C-methylase UbiE